MTILFVYVCIKVYYCIKKTYILCLLPKIIKPITLNINNIYFIAYYLPLLCKTSAVIVFIVIYYC